MSLPSEHITISDDKEKLQLDQIILFLEQSYWAGSRTKATIVKSIENSICFGVYDDQVQIGFARVVTDGATMYYLCDVFINPDYRGQGLGKRLVQTIVNDERWKELHGILVTKDAHGLYEQNGFVLDQKMTLRRRIVR